MKKITKKQIREKTKSTEVVGTGSLRRKFNHYYQHIPLKASFEKHHNEFNVMHNVGPNSYPIGNANNKKEFIDVVYNYLIEEK